MAIDTTIVRHADLTGDARADTVQIRLTGASIDAPIQWTLEIRADGRVLYTHKADDRWLDENFGQEPAFGTGNRATAKRNYYFELLPTAVVQNRRFAADNAMFDRGSSGSIYEVVPSELSARGMRDPAVSAAVVDQVIARLKAGTMILNIPVSPVQAEYPRIYVKELGTFIVFYKW